MRQQAREPRIIAQHRVEAEVSQFEPFGVQQPFGIGFRPDRLPDFFLQVVGQRFAGGVTQDHAKHIRFDAGVMEAGARRRDPVIELNDAVDGAFP